MFIKMHGKLHPGVSGRWRGAGDSTAGQPEAEISQRSQGTPRL